MSRKSIKHFIYLFNFSLLTAAFPCKAQKAVTIDDHVKQHIFSYNEIYGYEDSKNILKIGLRIIRARLTLNNPILNPGNLINKAQ